MAIVLFDNQYRKKLFPLTAIKAVADLRIGILTIKEWWEQTTQLPVYIQTENYLQPLYATIPNEEHFWVDASVIADEFLVQQILNLNSNQAIANEVGLIAGRATIAVKFKNIQSLAFFNIIQQVDHVKRIEWSHQLFQFNESFIQQHFQLLIKNKVSQPISSTNQVINPSNIFIEEGATVEYSMLNASTGSIYIGKNAIIMEGCIVRGPFAMVNNAVLKMGAKIYGATTIGKNSVAGGEIKNAILGDFSNKAHDGYLGDSVIGEWCNLGAGTNNSNIKNTASEIKIWNDASNNYENAGQKCGVLIGDYTRVAINTSINTGSNFGVCCNVFGEGLLPTLIPHFSWGTHSASKYQLEKAIADIGNWKQLKGKIFTTEEIAVLTCLYKK